MAENALMHYGTPKMRWGQRLYQYEDGTLTPAGRERYYKSVKKYRRNVEMAREKAKMATLVDRTVISRGASKKGIAIAEQILSDFGIDYWDTFKQVHPIYAKLGKERVNNLLAGEISNVMGTVVGNMAANKYKRNSFNSRSLY